MELLKYVVIKNYFGKASKVSLGQVTENWLTGSGQGKSCVLAAVLTSSLENIKGGQVTVPILSEGLMLLKKKKEKYVLTV